MRHNLHGRLSSDVSRLAMAYFYEIRHLARLSVLDLRYGAIVVNVLAFLALWPAIAIAVLMYLGWFVMRELYNLSLLLVRGLMGKER